MHRHEQVRAVFTCSHHALAQINVVVPIAGQDGAHIRLAVEQSREFARHREDHILFVGSPRPDRADIFTPMPGIDRNHVFACDRGGRRHWGGDYPGGPHGIDCGIDDRRQDRNGHRGGQGRDSCRRWDQRGCDRRWRGARRFKQIDDQTMSIRCVRRQQGLTQFNRVREIQHQPEILTVVARDLAQAVDTTLDLRGQAQGFKQAGAREIDDHAVRVGDRKDIEGGRSRQIQYQARLIGGMPHAQIFDLHGRGPPGNQ